MVNELSSKAKAAASGAVARRIALDAENYVRERDLPKLIPPERLASASDKEILEMLRNASNAQARKIASGHWTADLNRAMALKAALLAEMGRCPSDTPTPYQRSG